MKFKFLPDAFYASKHEPWLDESKFGNTFDSEKQRNKDREAEAQNKYDKDRMMHGKKRVGVSKDSDTYRTWKKKRQEIESQKPRMTQKGVKFYDKKGSGYMKGGKKNYD